MGSEENSSTDLGTEGRRCGRPSGWRGRSWFRLVVPVRWVRTVGLFDSGDCRKRSFETIDNLRLEPEPEPEAESCLLRSSALTSLHKHFECTRRVFLSSRHFSHWDTGRPLRLISKSGRSVWLQEEVRCPLIQDSLVGVFVSGAGKRCVGGINGVPCKLFVVDVYLLGSQWEENSVKAVGGRTMTSPSAAGMRETGEMKKPTG